MSFKTPHTFFCQMDNDTETYDITSIVSPSNNSIRIVRNKAITTYRFPWIYPVKGMELNYSTGLCEQMEQAFKNMQAIIDELKSNEKILPTQRISWLEIKIGATSNNFAFPGLDASKEASPYFTGTDRLKELLEQYRVTSSPQIAPYTTIKNVQVAIQPCLAAYIKN